MSCHPTTCLTLRIFLSSLLPDRAILSKTTFPTNWRPLGVVVSPIATPRRKRFWLRRSRRPRRQTRSPSSSSPRPPTRSSRANRKCFSSASRLATWRRFTADPLDRSNKRLTTKTKDIKYRKSKRRPPKRQKGEKKISSPPAAGRITISIRKSVRLLVLRALRLRLLTICAARNVPFPPPLPPRWSSTRCRLTTFSVRTCVFSVVDQRPRESESQSI